MELRVSDNGETFENVFIPADVTLFASGEAYFWALGAEFGVRAERVSGGCAEGCVDDAPVWTVQLFDRTMNGPEGEFIGEEVLRGHVDADTYMPGVVADHLDVLVRHPMVAITAAMEPGGKPARFIKWGSGLVSELYVREGAEAFASLVLDEV